MGVRICSRCVMDNESDRTIEFLSDGTCSYCNYALSRKDQVYFPNAEGEGKLELMINNLKREGKGKEFDCLMGLSGGLDSSFLAYLGSTKWDLRILAVHIDDGFDTEIAKSNIKRLCEKCKIQLMIEKPDETQYMDLLRSFIRSGVPGIAIPQDNVLLACLRRYAKRLNLKSYLSGANFALESILQRGNGYTAADCVHIRAIHKKYGEVPLNSLPLISIFQRYIGQKYIDRINTYRPLDFIEYNKDQAIRELESETGFNYYGGKHYESVFTKFVQVYYLPKKFRVDKRKSHLSSLIISGQMTRGEALEELKKPLYDELQMEQDICNILQKIGMSRVEFDRIMKEPAKSHSDYPVSRLARFAGLARKYRHVLSD